MRFACPSKWLSALTLCFLMSIISWPIVHSQHPSCKPGTNDHWQFSGAPPVQRTWTCDEGVYTLPTNFETTQLSSQDQIQRLNVGGEGNVGMDYLVPLPKLPSLRVVDLESFNENANTRFPFSRFLIINKQYLVAIRLRRVKLLGLTAADFQGFNRLETLWLYRCDVRAISVDVFSGLGYLPASSLASGKTQLNSLAINMNPQLVELDWSFLAPLADSLEFLFLLGNGLESDKTICSTSFSFRAMDYLALDQNARLTALPRTILDTLTEVNRTKFVATFLENGFCSGNQPGDCSCCELADLADWTTKNNMVNSHITLTCGRQSSKLQRLPISVFAGNILHEHCVRPQPEPEPEPQPEPQPSPTTAAPCLPVVPADPDTCSPVISPVVATCLKGILAKPSIELDFVEATRFELNSDQSRRCSAVAYDLHVWLLEKAGLVRSAHRRAETGVVAVCRGAGSLTVNELDPDAMESSNIELNVANTKKCRDIFHDFLQQFLQI